MTHNNKVRIVRLMPSSSNPGFHSCTGARLLTNTAHFLNRLSLEALARGLTLVILCLSGNVLSAGSANAEELDWLDAVEPKTSRANKESVVAPKSVSFASNTRDEDELRALRLQYFQAVKALRRKDAKAYAEHLEALSEYPIVDYLQYTYFDSLDTLVPVHQEVLDYSRKHKDLLPVQWIVKKAALEYANRERWDLFGQVYPLIAKPSQNLKCYKASLAFAGNVKENPPHTPSSVDTSNASVTSNRSNNKVKRSQAQALAHAQKFSQLLWRQGKAINQTCRKLIDAWQQSGSASASDHWTRFYRAAVNRRVQVAKDSASFLSKSKQVDAELLLLALEKPSELLSQQRRLAGNSGINRSAVLIALNQLARIDVKVARGHWQFYKKKHRYDLGTKKRIHKLLTRYTAWRDDPKLAFKMVKDIPLSERNYTLQIVLRELLRKSDWESAFRGIALLGKKEQRSDRWRYWKARLQVLTGRDDTKKAKDKAFMVYRDLAKKRGFYGYLSADLTGQDYQPEHKKPASKLAERSLYERMPGLLRARELFALNKTPLAKAEWLRATRGRSKDEYTALAQLALTWSWYHMSVQAMIDAKLWDALDFRFPKHAYADSFSSRANKFGLAPNLLFAIARQESAFDRTALSPAGARGLMQLMPYTAKETAENLQIETSEELLYIPDHNIELGSAYIDQMLAEFDNNRIFAIAAYNAGPHRVKDWRERSNGTLPFDVWIETIPFKETRGYVQNVLTYYVLYSYLHGEDTPLIQSHERDMVY